MWYAGPQKRKGCFKDGRKTIKAAVFDGAERFVSFKILVGVEPRTASFQFPARAGGNPALAFGHRDGAGDPECVEPGCDAHGTLRRDFGLYGRAVRVHGLKARGRGLRAHGREHEPPAPCRKAVRADYDVRLRPARGRRGARAAKPRVYVRALEPLRRRGGRPQRREDYARRGGPCLLRRDALHADAVAARAARRARGRELFGRPARGKSRVPATAANGPC